MTAGNRIQLPRIGFLGTGWIGRHRMEAIRASGEAEIVAIADLCPDNARAAAAAVPTAEVVSSLDELLSRDLDGIVIATPSAGHAEQAIRALDNGCAVFCQKPLARTGEETARVLAAARRADRLLAVDFSYRCTTGMREIFRLARSGELGSIYAADLVFHNAYGPDKPWFYDPRLAGGGCVMDLGSHLVDLALWIFDFPAIRSVTSSLYAKGRPVISPEETVEDYAVASIFLQNGGVVRIACSWNLPAGQDAVIESTFFGTGGGASFRNVNGSFYDFVAEHFRGTSRRQLAAPPDEWGGVAAVNWVRQLAGGARFDPEAEHLLHVATVLDAIYRPDHGEPPREAVRHESPTVRTPPYPDLLAGSEAAPPPVP